MAKRGTTPYLPTPCPTAEDPWILCFVCHGNICRSTMAQFVMEDLVNKAGLSDLIHVDSAGTTNDALGMEPHPGTMREMRKHHIPTHEHHARKIKKSEYGRYTLILYMDSENEWMLRRIFGTDPAHKLQPLLQYAPASYTRGRTEVDDPWYTGDYDATYADVSRACKGLLDAIESRCGL